MYIIILNLLLNLSYSNIIHYHFHNYQNHKYVHECYFYKKSGKFDFEYVGWARANGGGIDIYWLEVPSGKYDHRTVG